MLKTTVFLALALTLSGCTGLRNWLNAEPEFMKQKPAEAAREQRHGIGLDLSDAEYAEFERVKRENEEARKAADEEVFGFGF